MQCHVQCRLGSKEPYSDCDHGREQNQAGLSTFQHLVDGMLVAESGEAGISTAFHPQKVKIKHRQPISL